MTTMVSRSAFLAATLVVLAGCASSGGNGASSRPAEDTGSINVLTEGDFEGVDNYTVLEAIETLRPGWLRGRGPSIAIGPGGAPVVERSETMVRAYMDGVPLSGIGALDLIDVDDVFQIKFMSAIDATTRYGIDHERGAILVTTHAR